MMSIYTKYQFTQTLRYGAAGSFLAVFWAFFVHEEFKALAIMAGFILGILVGLSQIFLFEHCLSRYGFLGQFFVRLISVSAITIIIVFLLIPVMPASNLSWEPLNVEKVISVRDLFFALINIIGISSVLIIYFQVEKLIGRHKLRDYILDRYRIPRKEERIFMFLDLNSSTSLTEKMGNKKYYDFLNTFISDMTIPILETKAEIYQYVGDEVVFTWKLPEGLKNGNCVLLFYKIKHCIMHRKAHYMKNFGEIPTFKAGVHFGPVISAQIGRLKNEIIYSGDVLNTTARIESMCNEQQAELLISGDMAQKITLDNRFTLKPIGKIELKGKKDAVDIIKVTEESMR